MHKSLVSGEELTDMVISWSMEGHDGPDPRTKWTAECPHDSETLNRGGDGITLYCPKCGFVYIDT